MVVQNIAYLIVFIVLGLCFGSFSLATAWRIRKKRDFVHERSECERCHHTLAAKDLIPLFSWLSLGGKCRYCRKPLSSMLPIAELSGALVFGLSYAFWPDTLSNAVSIGRFIIWCVALVLLLVLFFYDLQWYILPNKVVYPLWAIATLDFIVRFGQDPTLSTIASAVFAVIIAAGIFLLLYIASKGSWIGYGDVRLGLAIGLLVGKPILAGLVLFTASVVGLIATLPSLAVRSRQLTSKIPFGPLLIIGLILVRLFGQQVVDWYIASLLVL